MKKFFVLVLSIFISTFSFAQIQNPVKWSYSVEQTKEGEATLLFKAKIDKEWHIYSQFTPQDGPLGAAPLPMRFIFTPNSCYELVGKVTEPTPHEEFDSTFEIKVLIHSGEVTLKQKIKFKGE